jgi:TonB family protein
VLLATSIAISAQQAVPVAERVERAVARAGAPGVSGPFLVKRIAPEYDAAAISREGDVWVDVVVGVDGRVGDVTVTRPLDSALDQTALDIVRRWEFSPARYAGRQPVQAIITLVVPFRRSLQTAEPADEVQAIRLPGGRTVTPPPGFRPPVLRQRINPSYSQQAMRARIQGEVLLDVEVLANGTVGRVKVAKSLDQVYGLDRAALDAAKLWLFDPATSNSQPVASVVTLNLEFRLH